MKIVGVRVERATHAHVVAADDNDALAFARLAARQILRGGDEEADAMLETATPETDEAMYVTPAARAFASGADTMTPAEFERAMVVHREVLARIERHTDRATVPLRLPYADGSVETVPAVVAL